MVKWEGEGKERETAKGKEGWEIREVDKERIGGRESGILGVWKEREGEERNVDRLGLERKGVDGRKGEFEGKVVAVRSQKPNVARTIREKVGMEKERRSGKGMEVKV